MYKQIVFWEPTLSPHKHDFFDALGAQLGGDCSVLCIADREVSGERVGLGWEAVRAVDNYSYAVRPAMDSIDALVHSDRSSVLHVFSGIRHFETILKGVGFVRRFGGDFGLMSEPRVREGFAGELRYLQSWLTEGWFRRNCKFVLAIGSHGSDWFSSVGYRDACIFPFAYFVSPLVSSDVDPARVHPLRVGYVGRFVEAKGVQFLIEAMADIRLPCSLSLVGGGVQEQNLRKLARQSNTPVEFVGVLQRGAVAKFLDSIDILVLPSVTTDDGWGVIVSEALLAGVSVVVSSSVGASMAVVDPRLGKVVAPRNAGAIKSAILELSDSGLLDEEHRSWRRDWASKHLSPIVGARYFLKIISRDTRDSKIIESFTEVEH